jgi:hypothetical protein
MSLYHHRTLIKPAGRIFRNSISMTIIYIPVYIYIYIYIQEYDRLQTLTTCLTSNLFLASTYNALLNANGFIKVNSHVLLFFSLIKDSNLVANIRVTFISIRPFQKHMNQELNKTSLIL